MKVIRKLLSETEGLPPNVRWSEDCGCVEATFDGGETWVESPPNDPRYGPGFRAPALTGIDAKCDAAARMVDVIRTQVDAAITATTAIELVTSLLAIIAAFIIGFSIIVAILWAVAEAIIAYGSAALIADFTEENYALLVCIFYDNIDEDGQVSTAQLSDVLVDIEAEWGISVIYPVVEQLIIAMGENGFSNAGALGTETGDCEDCIGCDPATCTAFDFDISDQGFVTHTWSGGDFQGGVYWTSGGGFPDGWLAQTQGGFNKIGLESHCDCIRADKVKVTTFGAAGGNAQLSIRISKHSDNTQLALKNFYINPTGAGSAVSESTWDVGGFVNEEDVDIEIGVKTTAGYGFMVTKLEFIET